MAMTPPPGASLVERLQDLADWLVQKHRPVDAQAVRDALASLEARRMPDLILPQRYWEALRTYVEWFGAVHDEDCPADDTCSCSYEPINAAVNELCREQALAGHGERPALPKHAQSFDADEIADELKKQRAGMVGLAVSHPHIVTPRLLLLLDEAAAHIETLLREQAEGGECAQQAASEER